jgi:flagellar motor switch protein FliM
MDTLSSDEVDVLLHSVDEGGITLKCSSESESTVSIANYDLIGQEGIVRGRIPTLERINERFSRHFSVSLFDFLKKPADISTKDVKVLPFSDYTQSLSALDNLNIIHFPSLKNQALVVMESQLIFTAVDHFFGGSGQFVNKAERSDFSPTEMRIIRLMMDLLCKDLQQAWKPVIDIDMKYVSSEINPQATHIIAPLERVVVLTLFVALKGGGGNINIVLPFSILDSINERLDTKTSGKRVVDKVWQENLKREVLRGDIPIKSLLVERKMTVQDVVNFQEGDVISIDMPDIVAIQAENVAILKGKIGLLDGRYAIQVTEKLMQDSFDS